MAIAVIVPDRNLDLFLSVLKDNTDEEIQVYPAIINPEKIEIAILWKQPTDILEKFCNLKMICSFGAGVDHIIEDLSYDSTIPVTRIVDDALTSSMCRYVLAAVSMFQYGFPFHFDAKLKFSYHRKLAHSPDLTVGILGLGKLGSAAAQICARCGYNVLGISKRRKKVPGVKTFADKEMNFFLQETNILICMLPLTAETEDYIDFEILNSLKKPAFFVNVGRGRQVIEKDLIKSIEDEVLLGACLDVVRDEPLNPKDPLLNYPRIIITPHIASITNQENAALQIIDNIHRLRNNMQLLNQISSTRGY